MVYTQICECCKGWGRPKLLVFQQNQIFQITHLTFQRQSIYSVTTVTAHLIYLTYCHIRLPCYQVLIVHLRDVMHIKYLTQEHNLETQLYLSVEMGETWLPETNMQGLSPLLQCPTCHKYATSHYGLCLMQEEEGMEHCISRAIHHRKRPFPAHSKCYNRTTLLITYLQNNMCFCKADQGNMD